VLRRPTTTSRSRKDRKAQINDRKTDKDRQGGRKRAQTGPIKRKSCFFCKDKVEEIDYKNVNQLRRYVSEKGKIRNRRISGACRRHQRQVAVAVKRAREMALLPYVTG
jgi:ribosomal protein S18